MKRKLEICFTYLDDNGVEKHSTILFTYDQAVIADSKMLNTKITQYIENQGFKNSAIYLMKEV
jgi:hypothetical protein